MREKTEEDRKIRQRKTETRARRIREKKEKAKTQTNGRSTYAADERERSGEREK